MKEDQKEALEEIDQEKETNDYGSLTEDYTFLLPPRIAKDGEFMERSHLLEVAFRSRLFDRDKDIELVETFYPDIYNLTQNDSRLVHNLVVYNKFNIF